ncbi:hypothetical protein Efla_001538 [Eimeria flavescens]
MLQLWASVGVELSGGIKWDEAVIEEHNLLRGTRAPIGEPKTPFNRERIDDGDDDEPGPINPAELASRLAMLQEAGDEQQEQEEAAAAQQQQEEDFKEKRRKHYNEFLESKLRLQALEEEDEDEDADD